MRLVRVIDLFEGDEAVENEDGARPRRYWRWYVRPAAADDDGSRTARRSQELAEHLSIAESFGERLVKHLGLGPIEAQALIAAVRWHDAGKRRASWQRAIHNLRYPGTILAKSSGRVRLLDLNRYRHEFGSLADLTGSTEFLALEPAVRELALHLIAAHHGRARPHFPEEEIIDPEQPEVLTRPLADSVVRRFGTLQRRYGRWGLAYLESLVRAADAMASRADEGANREVPE
jgi:CRISPR-associated endonuclease/helicase Cas3